MPAFEGAEGYGRTSQGGTGGQVVEVTTLADHPDDPPVGSLRYALEVLSGPRIVIPKVTGWVSLGGKDLTIRHPYVTFNASQGGHAIGVKDGGLFVRANHTIWRNLRVLPGPASWDQFGMNANGIFFWSTEEGVQTHHHIAANCSIGFTTDDHIGVNATDVTVQDCIIGPALECPSCGGKGVLVQAGSSARVSFIRNLQVHTYIGFPRATSAAAIDFINNVEYNSHGTPAQIMPVYGTTNVNFVGNVFLNGPSTYPNNAYQSIRTIGGQPYPGSIYVHDNIGRWWDGDTLHHDSLAEPAKRIIWGDNGGMPVASAFIGQGLTLCQEPLPSAHVLASVLQTVWPFPRSAFEERVVRDVRKRSGSWPETAAAYGGWPSLTGGDTEPPVIEPPKPPVEPPIPPVPPPQKEWEPRVMALEEAVAKLTVQITQAGQILGG